MNSISIKLTSKDGRHKISDKFELRSDLISHVGVTCHCNCSSCVALLGDLFFLLTPYFVK